MKKFVFLMISLLFFGCQKTTSIPLSNTVSQQINSASNLERELQIPPNETLLKYEKFSDDHYLMITTPLSNTPVVEDPFTRAKVWMKSREDDNFQLLKEHVFRGQMIEDIALRWDKTSFLDIQFEIPGDGLPATSQFINDYIDIGNKKIIASSLWTTPFTPEFSLEIGEKIYIFQLQAQNGCNKDLHDLTDSFLINSHQIKFKKMHRISCPIVAEGEATPTMPAFGAPSFHDSHFVTFNPPWGTPMTIDLETRVAHSNDLAHDFSLNIAPL